MTPSTEQSPIYVEDAIDSLPMRGLLLRVPVLCALLMIVEGMDTYAISYIAPFLSKELAISPERMGVIFNATVVASLLGALGLAPLSDRIGRRNLLIFCSVLIGPATLATAVTHDVPTLIALRFVIGIGFGAALPTTIALVTEYAPKRHRSMLVVAMSSSIVVGMVIVGVGAGLIIPGYGWRALLYVSGALSLLATVLLWAFLPESFRHEMKRDPSSDGAQRLLKRVLANAMDSGRPVLLKDAAAKSGSSVSPMALVRSPHAVKSGLFWFLMSASYSVVNFAVYWIPTIMLNQGYDIRAAAILGPFGQSCAVFAGIFVSWLMDRAGPGRVLCFCYIFSAIGFLTLANVLHLPVAAIVLLLLALSLLSAGISGSMALIAGAYGADIRATAVGWILGLARFIGGSAGTLVGGVIVGAGWTSGEIVLLIAAAVAAACISVLVIVWRGVGRAEAVGGQVAA